MKVVLRRAIFCCLGTIGLRSEWQNGQEPSVSEKLVSAVGAEHADGLRGYRLAFRDTPGVPWLAESHFLVQRLPIRICGADVERERLSKAAIQNSHNNEDYYQNKR